MLLSKQDKKNKVQSQSGDKAFLDEDQLMEYIANYIGVIQDECLSWNKQVRVVWLQNCQLPFHPERIGDIKDSMLKFVNSLFLIVTLGTPLGCFQ